MKRRPIEVTLKGHYEGSDMGFLIGFRVGSGFRVES